MLRCDNNNNNNIIIIIIIIIIITIICMRLMSALFACSDVRHTAIALHVTVR